MLTSVMTGSSNGLCRRRGKDKGRAANCYGKNWIRYAGVPSWTFKVDWQSSVASGYSCMGYKKRGSSLGSVKLWGSLSRFVCMLRFPTFWCASRGPNELGAGFAEARSSPSIESSQPVGNSAGILRRLRGLVSKRTSTDLFGQSWHRKRSGFPNASLGTLAGGSLSLFLFLPPSQ